MNLKSHLSEVDRRKFLRFPAITQFFSRPIFEK